MQPEDRRPIEAELAPVTRRVLAADAARSLAVGFALAAFVSAVLRARGLPIALAAGAGAAAVAAALLVWRSRSGRTPRSVSARIERASPRFHNILITAVELASHPERASGWMRSRVAGEASAHLRDLDPSRVVPLRTPMAWLAIAAAAWIAVALGLPGRAATAIRDGAARAIPVHDPGAGPLRLVVRLEPPQYTGQPPKDLVNPARIEAVAGTAMRLTVEGNRDGLRIRFGAREVPAGMEGRALVARMALEASGYVAIEPSAAGESDARRVLLPVSVTPDRAPVIRIDAPGKDLLLPAGAKGIPLSAQATDDFGLERFELRYTKVSGTGEQFEFEEGTLPLTIARPSARDWQGRAELPLHELKLAPGDALVYRAVARDGRPGTAGVASSDTYFVEIQGPGQVPLEGIEMPPDQERYALSQQMVLLKIQRLQARERAMPRAAVEEAAAGIAAEQRAVRANFVFLMGGHVEDEFEEAEQSHEIQEGRLENTARRDISAAIHHMTLAEQGLTAVSTARALPPARAAVEALQRAFGRSRYILRTLASRSRIDPSRRLTGETGSASDWRRDAPPATTDRTAAEARAIFAELLGLAAAIDEGRAPDARRVSALAERALAVDPASAEWQRVAQALLRLRDAAAANGPAGALRAALGEAIAPVMRVAQDGARMAPGPATSAPGALRGAWADEVRR